MKPKPLATKAKITITLLSLVLIAITCKKFTQTDLNNARSEGFNSALLSADVRALLEAQRKLSLKVRQVIHTADTVERTLLLEGINTNDKGGKKFYSTTEGMAEVKKWGEATKALITDAFGEPTNTDGATLSFAFQVNEKGDGAYNKIVIGLAKVNKVETKEKKVIPTPQDVAGDSVNNVDKSVTYTVGGYEFVFSKATDASLILSTANSGRTPEYAIYPVKLVLRKLPKKTALDEIPIANNLYATSAILSALQDALAQAIDAAKGK